MLPTRQGSIRLFRLFGIDVYLNWSWFLVLAYVFIWGRGDYSWWPWSLLEVLLLFAIVLTHEFGHSLACRQVGGKAEYIVLWPFGGVAYVSPPQRPGPVLWSIAAGPLVNVILAPILTVLLAFATSAGWRDSIPDLYMLILRTCQINYGLLIFNLLPIYPLDGGQILQALLWFVLGRARSLMVATVVGFVGVGILVLVVLGSYFQGQSSGLLPVLCVLILMNCWGGLMYARMLSKMAKMPHRSGFACPDCLQPPIIGPIWRCDRCFKGFDMFASHATCPHCGMQFANSVCPECGQAHPLDEWIAHGMAEAPARL